MDAPIHLIPTFLELTTTLNISRSAERLRLSQPAVSRQLVALEEALGVALFLRKSRGLELTSAGRRLKRELEPAYSIMRESLTATRHMSTALAGDIVLGCLAEVGKKVLVPLLLEFASLHTEVSLDIRFMSERLIGQGVADGNLGIGVLTHVPEGESLRAHHVLSERIVVVTSSSNASNLEDHPEPRFVGYNSTDQLVQRFLRKHHFPRVGHHARFAVAVNSHMSMLAATEKLSLYAVLPLLSVRQDLEDGKIRIASKKELVNEVFLIMPNHGRTERRYSEVTKFLLKKTKAMR